MPSPSALDYRVFTRTPTQASLLRLIVKLHQTTRIERGGIHYLALQLDKLAQMIGVRARSSVSRALEWLKENGLIQIVKDRWNRSPRLYLRPLIKPRRALPPQCNDNADATSTQRESNVTGCVGATCSHNDREEKEILKSGSSPADARGAPDIPEKQEKLDMLLKGPLKDAQKRIAAKADAVQAIVADKAPAPKIVAHRWVRLLAEYGYPSFDPNDDKHLAHIRKTIAMFSAPTVAAFVIELERRIGLWQNARPDRLKKTPPHPWALNRTDLLFKADEPEDDELTFTPLPKEPLASPPQQSMVDKPLEGSIPGGSVLPMAKGGIFIAPPDKDAT